MNKEHIVNKTKYKCRNCGKEVEHMIYFIEEDMLIYFDKMKKYKNEEIKDKPKYPKYYKRCNNCGVVTERK